MNRAPVLAIVIGVALAAPTALFILWGRMTGPHPLVITPDIYWLALSMPAAAILGVALVIAGLGLALWRKLTSTR